jgi:hypothetical protein
LSTRRQPKPRPALQLLRATSPIQAAREPLPCATRAVGARLGARGSGALLFAGLQHESFTCSSASALRRRRRDGHSRRRALHLGSRARGRSFLALCARSVHDSAAGLRRPRRRDPDIHEGHTVPSGE